MPSISFFIPCTPPTTTAQQKGACVVGGRVRFFKKKKVRQAEDTFWALLLPHRPAKPMEGPLSLVVTFRFPWRKSERKSRIRSFSHYPMDVRPDCENLFKAMGDVMTTLGFWRDDAQLSSVCIHKEWSDTPGLAVVLTDALATARTGEQVQILTRCTRACGE